MAEKRSSKKPQDAEIRHLNQRQHLIKRMSLTFGSVETGDDKFSKQKGVALREILDNSLDEVRGGYGEWVRVRFYADHSFEIQDSGRGIPVKAVKDANGTPVSSLVLALSYLQAGGKFETDSKRYSSGLNGLGGSAVVNVSRRVSAWIYREGKEHFLEFKEGTPGFFKGDGPDAEFEPLKDLTYMKTKKDSRPASEKKNFKTGTKLRVWLDETVFTSNNPYDAEDIISRLRGTAFLVPQLHAEVYNELNPVVDPETGDSKPFEATYHFPDGTDELIELMQPDESLHETITLKTEGTYVEKNVAVLQKDGKIKNQDLERIVPVELTFRYGDKFEPTIASYVNTIHTKMGGVHETAMERAFAKAFNERLTSMRGILSKGDEPPIADDYMEGLTAVLSVQVSEPVFKSQSKEELDGREVGKSIQDALIEELSKWIADRKNSDVLQVIAKKVAATSKARQKAAEQRNLNRQKNAISSASLPPKLLDCEAAGTEDAELYICEGDSAVTALKAARDGRVNALLGIRGKILNTYKATTKSIYANNEIQDIIKTLGAGSGSSFDIEKMRYGRVFIAVDADPDGNNIAVLLYTLFYTLFRPVIEEGRLFAIQTPLFVFTVRDKGGVRRYAQDEAERDAIAAELDAAGKKYTIARLKGLGESSEEVLEETAINPETRTITQIVTQDIESVSSTVELLLGTNADERKLWIESSRVDTEDLD